MSLFPRKNWTLLAHLLISHGRAVCAARKPQCDRARLLDLPKVGVAELEQKKNCPDSGKAKTRDSLFLEYEL